MQPNGYWTEGRIENINGVPTNVGGGVFVQGEPPVKNTVSSINTNNAVTDLNRQNDYVNRTYPQTTPTTKETPPVTPKIEPKAYFSNANGQEAEYTQEQLNTPEIQNALNTGGYFQVKTEGPTYDTSGNQKISNLTAESQALNTQISDALVKFNSYNVEADPFYQAKAKAIQNQFAELRKNMETANYQRAQAVSTMGYRGGTTRYAQGIQMGIQGAELDAANERIADINTKEADALSSAREAYSNQNFTQFNQKVNLLRDLRNDKTTELENLNKILVEANKKISEEKKKTQEIMIQSSRDGAIADLVNQGITDPTEIKALLDESAKASGYETSDFTADEIGKALKVFKPDEALAGLDSDYKTYNYLTSIGDPAVKGLSYLQYKTAVANATRAPQTEKNITISPEKKTTLLGVGFSQEDVNNIESDVQQHGLDKVLEGITDPNQKKALQSVYGVKEKVTREQLDTTVTSKVAYDGLKETYTEQELKDLADENGLSSMWTGKATDIERFLNSPEAKKLYADLLWKQYEQAGMTE